MAQTTKTPAQFVRIERALADRIRGKGGDDAAQILLSEGWIDVDWAAEHTRERESDAS